MVGAPRVAPWPGRVTLVAAQGIVLLHDGGGDRSATVEALPRIIDGLKKRHLAFVTL